MSEVKTRYTTKAGGATTPLRERMREDLKLAGYSDRTQDAYIRAVKQLAQYYHKSPDQLDDEHIRDYFLHLKEERKWLIGASR